jgi:hypothetical protein
VVQKESGAHGLPEEQTEILKLRSTRPAEALNTSIGVSASPLIQRYDATHRVFAFIAIGATAGVTCEEE